MKQQDQQHEGLLKKIKSFLSKKPTNWEEKTRDMKKARGRYERIRAVYKRLIILEAFERNMSGFLTLVVILLAALSLILDQITSYKTLVSNFTFIQIIEYTCKAYCVIILIFVCLLTYFKNAGDPFRFIAKIIKLSWIDLQETLDRQENEQTPSFRGVDPNNKMQELILLTDLGIEAYGTDHITRQERFSKYKEWYEVRPDVFSFILKADKVPVGFICALPLNTDKGHFGRKHYDGNGSRKITQFDITANMIAHRRAELIFLQGYYVRPPYLDYATVVVNFLQCFYYKTADFINSTYIDQTIVYSEPYTGENIALLKLLGFQYYGNKSATLHKLYELRFTGEHNSQNAYQSNNRIRLIKDKLNETSQNKNRGRKK